MNSRQRKIFNCLLLWNAFRKIQKRQRRYYVRPLNRYRGTRGNFRLLIQDMRTLDEERFFQTFRMTKARFDDLLSRIKPYLAHFPTHSSCIGPAERLALTLQILASGMSQQNAAITYRMGKSTVNGIFYETLDALWYALQPQFLPPPTLEIFQDVVQDFWHLWNFPLCCGAIDGKHITIKSPRGSGSMYFNYKGYYSMILMACVDANYKFLMVDIGAFGRQGDAWTFSSSPFGKLLLEDKLEVPQSQVLPGTDVECPHVFIGDEAFPLRTNLLRPFPKSQLNDNRRIYNYRLSRARRIVENAFGILAARWRILNVPIEAKPENVDKIVKATVILHNYLKSTDATTPPNCRYIPPAFVDYEGYDGVVQPGEWRNFLQPHQNTDGSNRLYRNSNNYTRASYEVRDRFVKYFQSTSGSVPWQRSAAL